MRIVQINSTCGVGSTGKICVNISRLLSDNGIENYVLYSSRSNGYPLGIKCSSDRAVKLQALKARLIGNYGFNSRTATKKMIRELERLQPDIVHLHNIHGHDCHLGMLFDYFRKNSIKLIWTFHDCWAFTGYCMYFTLCRCDKWQSCCGQCVQKNAYSWLFDRSQQLFEKKKELFDGLDLTIVTPSMWLADLVKQSFLKDYPVRVINNGIDLKIFHPVESDFRQRYGIKDRQMILGVSFEWEARKGLDVFIGLAQSLPDNYKIVLVGTNDAIDRQLPDNILSIHRTQDQHELAAIYSAADVLLNPTREENYPTVNMEAIACGTPVITFKTGGSPEMIDETCGAVVAYNDNAALEKEILRVCGEHPYTKEQCITKSLEYDENNRFTEYVSLYERINAGRNESDRT